MNLLQTTQWTPFIRFRMLVVLLAAVLAVVPWRAAPAETPVSLKIEPDYTGITLPPNIAPLNFKVLHPGRAYQVILRSTTGEPLTVKSRQPRMLFPEKSWRALLEKNAGQALLMEVQIQQNDGQWLRFPVVTNWIAAEPVDGYLVYRLLRPLYNYYSTMGIYQRNLGNFSQVEVLENKRLLDGCLNCHTFQQHSPVSMFFHTRGGPGNSIIMVRSNETHHIARTGGYASWHPSGRLVVYSVNQLSLFFHTRGSTRDVFDADSDLHLYRLDTHQVAAPPAIAATNRNETWPSWSPDGRYLYFCSAEPRPQERFREVRYDLMRVAYDLATDTWGQPETLMAARETQLSAALPRVSPDGRWLVFTLTRYGNFPIYQAGADLFLMDLSTREVRRLPINSDQTDSWHGWSSNSRWLVFSSKRRDGVFTLPYFSHVTPGGEFSKPFVLPQEDPEFYDTFVKNFNLPEFITSPVTVKPSALAQTILAPRQKIQPGSDPVHPPRKRSSERGAAQ